MHYVQVDVYCICDTYISPVFVDITTWSLFIIHAWELSRAKAMESCVSTISSIQERGLLQLRIEIMYLTVS